MKAYKSQPIDDVITLALQAGKAILDVYQADFTISHKDDNSPLTQADLASHHMINAGLLQMQPGWPVLSEESAVTEFNVRRHWNPYWLVDPLDGTREFIKRNGEFTVNIALIENHIPVMGVVHAPVLGQTYFAVRGKGAYRLSENESPRPIHVRELDLTRVTVAGSRSHSDQNFSHFLDKLGPHELISMGSSLKICLVAEGRADVYPRLGPTSEWDTAAAHCILEEAGGQIIDVNGKSLRYNSKESILNPWFFASGSMSQAWTPYLGTR